MKVSTTWWKTMMVALTLLVSQQVWAGPKTLIELEGDTPKPGLAKSWSKVKDGEYSFDLDATAEVAKGVAVTPAIVKSSLEGKLGSTLGLKVTPKGASGVSIAYTGDEKAFLDALSKTKVRPGQDVELALESSTSEGSIRAKKTERAPNPGEVKAMVLTSAGGLITAKTTASQTPAVKSGEKVKIKGDLKGLKKNDMIYFKPGTKEGDVLVPAPGSLLQ